MKKLLLLLSLIIVCEINAQSWLVQNTNYPVTGSYTGDISIVDENIIWTMVQRTTTTNHQTYGKSIDGGLTWINGPITVGNATGVGIANISAISADIAWVSAFPTAAGLATQGVYKTTNGGTTWTRQSGAAFNTSSFTNFVHFWDANNGVCMGDKRGGYFEIYTTTNGGTNWTRTQSVNIPTTSTDFGYVGKYFVKGNTIWFGTDGGELMKSIDKGLTWTKIITPITDFGGGTDTTSAAEFSFKDDNNGVILKENFDGAPAPDNAYVSLNIYTTTDGGITWNEVVTAPNSLIFHGAVAYSGDILISAGSTTDNFGSSYSIDNGVNWIIIDDNQSHTTLNFKDSSTLGWGGGFSQIVGGGIYKFQPNLSNSTFEATANFKVYPNPANNTIQILCEEIDSYKLKITDLLGKVVLEKSLSGLENNLDISNLTIGTYLFVFNSDKKFETIKIIKN